MISNDLAISFSGNFANWLLIAGMILSFAFSVWTYIRTLPPVKPLVRIVLAASRWLALCGGLMLLHHTVIESHRTVQEPASIAILLDRSSSMSILQGGVDRQLQVDSILNSGSFTALYDRYSVNIWQFDDSLAVNPTAVKTIVDSRPGGVGTNISRAWMELGNKNAAQPQALTIIFSDGAHNSGPDPVRQIRKSLSPVWTVGIGSEKPYRDAMLLQVISNKVVYQGSTTPIEVSYRIVGITSDKMEMSIRDSQNRLIESRIVKLPTQSGTSNAASNEGLTVEGIVEFDLDITKVGKQRFSVEIKPFDQEIETDNNQRSFYINALSHRMNVLLLAGTPSNSLGNLVRILSADEHIELIQRTTKGASFYEGKIPDSEMLAKADVVLFHDFPTKRTPPDLLAELVANINRAELPTVYFDGSGVSLRKLRELGDLFSFAELSQRTRLSEGRLKPVMHHAIIAEPEDFGFKAKWDVLPPVIFAAGRIKFSQDNTVLASFFTDEGSTAFPAIVISENRNRKSAVIMAHDLWKWSLAETSDEPVLQPLISRLIRWLAVRKAGKQVEINLPQDLFSSREAINFTVTVLNENYLPVVDAIVTAEISFLDTVGGVAVLEPMGKGKYSGLFSSWGEGDYSINVSAVSNDQLLGNDVGHISVEAFNLELLDSRLNKELLTAIGESTGGGYIAAARVDSFLRSIDIQPIAKQIDRQWVIWGKGWLLWTIIILLSLEWYLRIKNGLL